MKNLFILLVISLFLFTACEEQMVVIPEITSSESKHQILIEEFTGANCSACPQGAAAIKDLQSIYPGKVIAVAIHTNVSGTLGKPLDGSKYDLRTSYGDDIAGYLGPLSSIPSAAIDRKLYEGQPGIAITPFSAWSGIAATEIEAAPEVIIGINATFDTDSRVLRVQGNILPEQNVDGDIRLVGYITESHIVDKQLNGTEIIDDYEHDHILREVLKVPGQEVSSIEGNPLVTPMAAQEVIPYEFAPFTIPEEDGTWKVENCHVVVFVVRYDTATGAREVLQASEVDFVE